MAIKNKNWMNFSALIMMISTFLETTLQKPYPQEEAEKTSNNNQWVNLKTAKFSFDCYQRSIGFYADVEYDCHIFHMCDIEGKRIPYTCANETSFNQEHRICDWSYNFNCEDAPKWYYLNDLTYATDPLNEEEEFEDEDN